MIDLDSIEPETSQVALVTYRKLFYSYIIGKYKGEKRGICADTRKNEFREKSWQKHSRTQSSRDHDAETPVFKVGLNVSSTFR